MRAVHDLLVSAAHCPNNSYKGVQCLPCIIVLHLLAAFTKRLQRLSEL